MTVRARVLEWVDQPRHDATFGWYSDTERRWVTRSHAEVADDVRAAAAALADRHQPGAAVLLVSHELVEQVVSFYGALYAGLRPCIVAPPGAARDHYPAHLAAAVNTLTPAAVYVGDHLGEAVQKPLNGHGPSLEPLRALRRHGAQLATARAIEEARVVQLTSGSTGTAKAVVVDLPTLDRHTEAIATWLRLTTADKTASWLPLHHDMGLVGMVMTSLAADLSLELMTPLQFVRSPARYLSCFAQGGATLSGMPPFGLRYLTRRIGAAHGSGLHIDLSAWRVLIVGAERVTAQALEGFECAFATCRVSPTLLCPAYGLAEATLAVSGALPSERWRTVVNSAGSVVSCGPPLRGRRISVVDDAGVAVPDGTTGEIELHGDSQGVAMGAGRESPGPFQSLRTGDAGFIRDGELFPLGRLGDSLKLNGSTVFAEDVEVRLVEAGLDPDRLCVLLGHGVDGERAVILLERPEPAWAGVAGRVAASLLGTAIDCAVVTGPSRTIARTTSGKPRRRELWQIHGGLRHNQAL